MAKLVEHGARAEAGDAALVTKAALRAAHRLGLSQAELARVLGVGPASVSRMAAGRQALDPDGHPKAYEIALHLVRLWRSLDALAGEDAGYAAWWLRQPNRWLGEVPADAIRTVRGLLATVDHLDAFRARV